MGLCVPAELSRHCLCEGECRDPGPGLVMAECPDLAGHPHVQCRTSQRDPQGVGMPHAERPGAAIDI